MCFEFLYIIKAMFTTYTKLKTDQFSHDLVLWTETKRYTTDSY